jgi:hypothetical protein
MDEVQIRQLQPGTEITLVKHIGQSSGTATEEKQ